MAAPVEPPDPVVDPARIRGDIRPFFRPIDIGSMLGSFDLASFEDVCANAQDILDAVASQFVPCDGPWPPERVELFRRWVDGGSSGVDGGMLPNRFFRERWRPQHHDAAVVGVEIDDELSYALMDISRTCTIDIHDWRFPRWRIVKDC